MICAAMGVLAATLLVLALLLAKPELYIILMQKMWVEGNANSFEPKENSMQVNDPQITYISDIRYGDVYPNSYLDIYCANEEGVEKKPVFFYIHGGGFAGGDKMEGDPAAASSDAEGTDSYLLEICKRGWQVVSVNYALIPEYLYPVPISQIDEAVRFLQEHQEEYGLDMTKVVFCGGSAGGQLAGQYVNIQTNEAYAQEMKLEQALGKENVAGVVLNSALLRPADFEKVGSLDIAWMYSSFKRVYFENDPEVLAQADVIEHASADFPPAYITDGNHVTFDDQAKELAAKLEGLVTEYIFNYYEASEAALGHGYDSDLSNVYARKNLEKVLEFLEGTVKPECSGMHKKKRGKSINDRQNAVRF